MEEKAKRREDGMVVVEAMIILPIAILSVVLLLYLSLYLFQKANLQAGLETTLVYYKNTITDSYVTQNEKLEYTESEKSQVASGNSFAADEPLNPYRGMFGDSYGLEDREDFEKYPWDSLADRYFERFGPQFKALEKTCPEGMKAVGGVGNGVFECVQDLVGYIPLCFLREDDPELYADLFRKIGDVLVDIWQRFLAEYSGAYCVLRFGDDLGFNSSTLLSADDVRDHILPQYRRITDLVHATGRPFLLHSCGNLLHVFDDIISMANIEAKHSNEDCIAHFAIWAERFGDRIGNFGGIDTDVLCRSTPEYIREYVADSIARAKPHGGIAFGSGNSIPDYVPTEGYLAMIEAVRDIRGDKPI